MRKKVERHDFLGELKEFHGNATQIYLRASYADEDYEIIKLGMMALNMDHRWFILSEGDEVFFYRSWTGQCIFKARFVRSAVGHRISQAWVSRDPNEPLRTDDAEDADLLKFLIEHILLRRPVSARVDVSEWND